LGIPPDTLRRSRAFTLVELIVALAIGLIVVLAANQCFRLGLGLWHNVEDPRRLEEQGRAVVRMIRFELAGAYMPPTENGKGKAFQFVDERERGRQELSFFTTTPSYYRGLPPGRCAHVTYVYQQSSSGPQETRGVLVRREQLVAGEEPIGESIADIVADGLSSFPFTCMYKQNDGSGGRDGDVVEAPHLPRLVGINMVWPIKETAHVRAGQVRFATQFLIPSEDSLVAK
jgi:prepilin-type N-terminal cleavage/methylation domain-containing protein